jgi:hypothetical protein
MCGSQVQDANRVLLVAGVFFTGNSLIFSTTILDE